jgi:cyanophycin synthetase
VGIIGCAGDRRDEDIITMGRYAGEIFDEIIIRHDKDGRGRTNEELTSLIMQGIYRAKQKMQFTVISDEIEALTYAMEHAENGSFIVLSSDETKKSIEFVTVWQQENKQELVNQF